MQELEEYREKKIRAARAYRKWISKYNSSFSFKWSWTFIEFGFSFGSVSMVIFENGPFLRLVRDNVKNWPNHWGLCHSRSSDANDLVNRSICCHGTHSLYQEDIGVFTDAVAPCELALRSEDPNADPSLHVLIAPLTCNVCTFHNFVEDRCSYLWTQTQFHWWIFSSYSIPVSFKKPIAEMMTGVAATLTKSATWYQRTIADPCARRTRINAAKNALNSMVQRANGKKISFYPS